MGWLADAAPHSRGARPFHGRQRWRLTAVPLTRPCAYAADGMGRRCWVRTLEIHVEAARCTPPDIECSTYWRSGVPPASTLRVLSIFRRCNRRRRTIGSRTLPADHYQTAHMRARPNRVTAAGDELMPGFHCSADNAVSPCPVAPGGVHVRAHPYRRHVMAFVAGAIRGAERWCPEPDLNRHGISACGF